MNTFIVHMAGKTGSQTIQQTLLASVPGSTVERHHFFSPITISELRAVCALPDAVPENADSVLSQCTRAERCRENIIADRTRPKTIISAYRDPYGQSIAAMFQNLQTFIPEYDADLPADHWVEQLIDRFVEVFANREVLATSCKFLERRRARPIIGFANWFETDFNPSHGVDIYRHEIDDIGTVQFVYGPVSYLVYRLESLDKNFERIVSAIPGIDRVHRVDTNYGFEKPSGDLYKLFLGTIRLTYHAPVPTLGSWENVNARNRKS